MTDEPRSVWEAATDEDRKRGFLTQRDRDYILGEVELGDQQERDLRYRIRNRVENGLLDMTVLDDYPDDELEKIITSADYSSDNLVVFLYSLAYRVLLLSYGTTLYASAFDDLSVIMEDMLEHSIERFERHRGGVSEVNIDIDIERSELDEDMVLNRILAGNATVEEYWTYIETGDVDRLISRLEAEGKEDQVSSRMRYLRAVAESDQDE